MSLSAAPAIPPHEGRSRLLQFLLAAGAVALVAAASLLLWLVLPGAPAPKPAAPHPFGIGLPEAAAATGGLGRWILAWQSAFNRSLENALFALKQDGGAGLTLIGLGFGYGIFHAAGPGHGKGVIAAYLVANERTLAKGFMLSLAAALLQAASAILLVGIVAVAMRAGAASISRATAGVEMASFALVAGLGAWLSWRKAGQLLALVGSRARMGGGAACGDDCGHLHMPPPSVLERLSGWRGWVATAFAAGLRPCAGAILILVLALSQNLLAAGIAATLAMALGTALTTGAIAALAVYAKRTALSLAGGEGRTGAVAIGVIELATAAFVFVLGISLLAGSEAGLYAG